MHDRPDSEHGDIRNKLQRTRRIIRSLKAKTDAHRTPAERFADWATSKFGSVSFFGVHAIIFAAWIVANLHFIPGIAPFDPYPFQLLTMIVSLEAIFLSIIVLVSQNRGADIDTVRDETDLQVDIIAEQELTKILEVVTLLAQKQGIDLRDDRLLREMLKPTDTARIERVLEHQVMHERNSPERK